MSIRAALAAHWSRVSSMSFVFFYPFPGTPYYGTRTVLRPTARSYNSSRPVAMAVDFSGFASATCPDGRQLSALSRSDRIGCEKW